MEAFSQYYVGFIQELIRDIADFVKNIYNSFANLLYTNILKYFNKMITQTNAFGIIDWICFVFVFLINVGFIIFLVLRIYQYIRRKRRYRKKQFEKEDLLEEIETLNYKIEELISEKNQIFAMKVSSLGLRGSGYGALEKEDKMDESKEKQSASRFAKLMNVDEKYELSIVNVNMFPEDMVNLPQLVERFINFAASQMKLFYDKRVVSFFFAGMATTKVMILEGISGTGKTSLPYAMGKFFNNDADIVSVQPSWRDRAEIIGYLNEFTKKFNETDFLKALYETTYREDINFIVLDEMNLARIEYYFAEFLSIMEMPDPNEWKIDVVPESIKGDPINIRNGKILLPQNVWFVGTANKDDSTFTITDKVYDRATKIEMNHRAQFVDAPLTQPITMSYEYLDQLFQAAEKTHTLSNKSLENIQKLDRFIADTLKVTFGNRIMKQLKIFVPVSVGCGIDEVDAIDYFITHKVLRKFEALNLSFLHKELEDLIVFFDKMYGKGVCNESINYIRDLIKNS